MIKCIVIEDEVPAQKVLIHYIGQLPELELKGVFKSALEASQMISKEKVDLLFLDINLPVLSGIGFLRTLQYAPKVIMTTAYPEYAVESYELNVQDYLLKPFSFERFLKAINKIKEPVPVINEVNITAEKSDSRPKTFFVNVDKTLHAIKSDEILFLESIHNYVKIITFKGAFSVLDNLKSWEDKLMDLGFLRTHKSFIVNCEQVNKIYGNTVDIQGKKIPIGRSYRKDFLTGIQGQ